MWDGSGSSSNNLPPLIGEPPPSPAYTVRYNRRSMETLVVVLAVITIVAVIAGVIARMCGGRHLAGDHDIEGCVERSCSRCIDGGLSPPPPPPPPPPEQAKPVAEEPKS